MKKKFKFRKDFWFGLRITVSKKGGGDEIEPAKPKIGYALTLKSHVKNAIIAK